jgi:hypothetical protein
MIYTENYTFSNTNPTNITVTGELVMDMIVCLVDLHLHMLLLPIIRKVEKVKFELMVRCTRYKIGELH